MNITKLNAELKTTVNKIDLLWAESMPLWRSLREACYE